jgi:hypothetical protein
MPAARSITSEVMGFSVLRRGETLARLKKSNIGPRVTAAVTLSLLFLIAISPVVVRFFLDRALTETS